MKLPINSFKHLYLSPGLAIAVPVPDISVAFKGSCKRESSFPCHRKIASSC